MTHDPFKYTKFERERRFLIAPAALPVLSVDFARYEDLYLTGTQIRLRGASEVLARASALLRRRPRQPAACALRRFPALA